jgi:hypothetical protein
MPWLFRHCTNDVRLALEPEAEADADVVLELLVELPHAARARLAVIAPSAGIRRSARRGLLLGDFMDRSFCDRGGVDQPPLEELAPVEPLEEPPPAEPPADPPLPPLPVVRAPESLTEVATRVPLEFFTPWMTTESPGWSALLETPRLFVSLVDEESVTLTVFPVVSVR